MAPTNVIRPEGFHAATFGSFTIERGLKAPPARVFDAWARPEAKGAWFVGGAGWTEEIRSFDFREGHGDRLKGVWQNGHASDFRNTYREIVPGKRIVYAYDMYLDGVRISISLATIEFSPEGTGTLLKLTEQGVFLVPFDADGDDNGSRERGTRLLVEQMAAWVEAN